MLLSGQIFSSSEDLLQLFFASIPVLPLCPPLFLRGLCLPRPAVGGEVLILVLTFDFALGFLRVSVPPWCYVAFGLEST